MSTIIEGTDYGPLAQLIGTWAGNKGIDVAPDAEANPDENLFSDELVFTTSGAAENAEEQQLVTVAYRHVVVKTATGLIFHDQVGHWIYEPSTGAIMYSLSIPRGVCVLAGGHYQEDGETSIFQVKATADSDTFGIIQSPFMREKATTTAFTMDMQVTGDKLTYKEIIALHIYGKDFEHTDTSTLQRVVHEP